jgi:hypothetical protein
LLDPAKLEKASLNNVAFAFTQVYQAHRLCTGGSTQNLSVLSRIVEKANATLFEPQDKSERA